MKNIIRSVVAIAFAGAFTTIYAVGSFACGGGNDCASLCQESQDKKCAGALKGDCTNVCTGFQNVANKASCSDKLDSAVSCEGGLSDICTTTSCNKDTQAFATCLTAYCTKNANDADCKAALAGLGL